MTRRVATPRPSPYLAAMPAFSLVRLFTMLALLLMPVAMAGQGHAVAAAPHHGTAASAEGHHHDGSGPHEEERKQDGVAQCMTACAALPAMDAPAEAKAEAPRPILFALPVVPIDGLAPEAATPPPRTA